MSNRNKMSAAFALILLASMIVMAISPYVATVKAQGQVTVNVLTSIGGTPDPAPGTDSYDAGATVTLTGNPDVGYVFQYWIISSVDAFGAPAFTTPLDNPFTLTVAAEVDYTVSAVFTSENTGIPGYYPRGNLTTTDAVVVLLASAGGTTNPPPGAYPVANATELSITAVPNDGWKFAYWIISGDPMTGHGGYPFTATPTDNPYIVGHGYGFTYNYQAVFVPVETTAPPPTTGGGGGGGGGVSSDTTVIVLVVVIVVILVAFGAYAYTRRSKK